MPDIEFKCPHCGKSLAIDGAGAGITVQCPDCQKQVVVPSRIPSQSKPQKPNIPLIVTSSLATVFAIWALIATIMAMSRGASVRGLKDKLASVRSNISMLEADAEEKVRQAEREVAKAKQDAKKITAAAKSTKKELEIHRLREEGNLHQIFGQLQTYRPGRNEVNQRYLEAFEVSHGRIKTFMRNRGGGRAKPNFTINFLTKYGFVTDTFHKSWLLDSMGSGESRIDDDTGIHWRFGQPIYYTIDFSD